MQPEKKFRSLEEVRKYLKEMSDQLSLEEQLIEKNNKQLARIAAKVLTAIKIIDITGDGPTKRRKRTLNVDFPVVQVPDAKFLEKNYKFAAQLSEQYKYVMNLENEVKINFRNTKGKVLEDTLGSISKLKAELEKNLKEIFFNLAKVADGHAPKEYKAFVSTLAEELMSDKHVQCDDAKTVTYAALSKDGALIFAGYIILQNAINDEGRVAPTLYITIKWTVGEDVEIFVEHEFVPPSHLSGGTVVDNIHQAAKAVADQLSLEGFSSVIGNLPAELQLKIPQGDMSKDIFDDSESIKSVGVEHDQLIFELDSKLSSSEVEQVRARLFMNVKAMLKNKRKTTVRMQTLGHRVVFTFSGLEQSSGIHPIDLDWVAEKYKLTPSQLRKIVNVINNPDSTSFKAVV